MKKTLLCLLTFLCVLLSSCKDNETQAYFVGKVIEISDDRVTLEITNNGNQNFASGDIVEVRIDVDDYNVGEYLRVEFDGTMALSYPPQIFRVYDIEKTDALGNRYNE